MKKLITIILLLIALPVLAQELGGPHSIVESNRCFWKYDSTIGAVIQRSTNDDVIIGATSTTSNDVIMEIVGGLKVDNLYASTSLHTTIIPGTSDGDLDMNNYDILNINSATTTAMYIGQDLTVMNGNVGIGTASPEEKLDVHGKIRISNTAGLQDYLFYVPDSRNTLSFQSLDSGDNAQFELFAKDGDGTDFVGMNYYGKGLPDDTTDTEVLTTRWNPSKSWFEMKSINTGTGTLRPISIFTDGYEGQIQLDTTGNVGINTTTPIAKFSVKGAGATTGRLMQITDSNNVEKVTILDNGNVGIGTTNPGVKLDINGNYFRVYSETAYTPQWIAAHYGDTAGSASYMTFRRAGGTFASPTDVADNNTLGTIVVQGYYDGSFRNAASIDFLVDGTPNGTNIPAEIRFSTNDGSASAVRMSISNEGYVGIDDTTPDYGLEIATTTGKGYFAVSSAAANDGNIFIVNDTGNVGIGISSPEALIHGKTAGIVFKGERTTTAQAVVNSSFFLKTKSTGDIADGFGGGIVFMIGDATVNEEAIATVYGIRDTADDSGALTFNTYDTGVRGEHMRITHDGKVGIGTTGPEGKLNISGNPANNAPSILLSGNVEDIAAESGEHTTFGEYNAATDTFTEHWRVQSGGNIGMGSSAPNNKLHLKVNTDGQGLTIQRNSTDANIYADLGFLLSTDDALAPQTYIRAYRRTAFADNDMVFHVGGTDIMYLDDSGNIGIGTTTPKATLDVDGTSRFGESDVNYCEIGTEGEIKLFGLAQVWKSIDLNPIRLTSPIADPPAEGTYNNFRFDRYDRGTVEQVYFKWHVPDDFATSSEPTATNVRGHYGLLVENPPVGTGDEYVVMGFEYKKLSPGDVFDFTTGTATGTITITIEDDESPYTWHESPTGYCTTTDWDIQDVILFRFYRDATNPNDTYDNEAAAADNDAWVGMYHIQYKKDKLGASD